MAHVTSTILGDHLPACLEKEIAACETPEVSGCPHIAQICAMVLDRLGFHYHIIHGKGLTRAGKWVDHFWIDVAETNLRIETNPVPMLDRRGVVAVLHRRASYIRQPYEYLPEGDFPELLENIPPDEMEILSDIASAVTNCLMEIQHPNRLPKRNEAACAYCEGEVSEGQGVQGEKALFCDESCLDLYRREKSGPNRPSGPLRASGTQEKTDIRYHG